MPTPATGSIANFPAVTYNHTTSDTSGHLLDHDILEWSAYVHDGILTSASNLAGSLDLTTGFVSGASVVFSGSPTINNPNLSGSIVLAGGSVVPITTGQYNSAIFGQQSSMIGVDLVNSEAYGLFISPTTGLAFYGVEDTASTQVV